MESLAVIYILFVYCVFGVGVSRAVDNDDVNFPCVILWPLILVIVAVKGNK